MRVELSEIECEKIVKNAAKHENVKVETFSLESFGLKNGFLGEYFRLKINAAVNNEPQVFNFFVKSLPVTDLKQRKMLIETGIFRKEVKLYEDLLLDLSKLSTKENCWCPNGYYFRDDLLVLDNMTLKGYKMLPFRFKFEKSHVDLTLKSLASFHCSSIVYEEMNGKNSIVNEFEKVLFETSVADITWYHAGLKVITFLIVLCSFMVYSRFIYSQAIYEIALQKTKYGKTHTDLIIETFYPKIFESIENMESTPSNVITTLSHRDVWKNNIMFKFADDNSFENPLHCVLLDYQTIRYLSITIDALMAIICTTTRSHYEENYNCYLRFYYDQLASELKIFSIDLCSKMSFENFTKSCEFHKTFSLVYNCIILMITTIPQEYFIDFTEDEYRDFAEGNRSKFILDIMQKDSTYEESLIEAVEAAIEFIYQLKLP